MGLYRLCLIDIFLYTLGLISQGNGKKNPVWVCSAFNMLSSL